MEYITQWNTNLFWYSKKYPSVPTDEAVAIIIEILNNDIDERNSHLQIYINLSNYV